MSNVLIVAYLLIVLALIGVILVQRSEGGGLGMGGGGGFMTARGSANLLTRTTAVLATLFFALAIGLTILSEVGQSSTESILDQAGANGGKATSVLDALNNLQRQQSGSAPSDATPQPPPVSQPPAADAGANGAATAPAQPQSSPAAPDNALDLPLPTPQGGDTGASAPGGSAAPASQPDSAAPAGQ